MKQTISAEELENWFEDNGMEAMETMSELLKTQHQLALELTKLVLEHGKLEKTSKEEIFNIFKDAAKLMAKQMDMD